MLHITKAKSGHGRQAKSHLHGSFILVFSFGRQETCEFFGGKVLPMLVWSMETLQLVKAMHGIECYQSVTQ